MATKSKSKKNLGRMRNGTIVLARSDSEAQIGTDDRWAVRLYDLKSSEIEWLQEMASRPHLPPEGAARSFGVDVNRIPEIIETLKQCGYWLPDAPRSKSKASREFATGVPDSAALGSLRGDGHGQKTLIKRSQASVAISDSGRVGAAIARQLATAGIGRLILPDTKAVQVADVGLGGYRASDVGKLRAARLGDQVRACANTITLRAGHADVVVTIEGHATRPRTWTRLMGEAVPHLLVVASETTAQVGPFVMPGRTACGNCLHLHRRDADPKWPKMAEQLEQMPVGAVETALASSTAALACAQVLAYLDGMTPRSFTDVLHLSLPQCVAEPRPCPPHPECGCNELHDIW